MKSWQPKIHGGILARRGIDDATLAEHQIDPIDLLVVNLYPFAKTIAKEDASLLRWVLDSSTTTTDGYPFVYPLSFKNGIYAVLKSGAAFNPKLNIAVLPDQV